MDGQGNDWRSKACVLPWFYHAAAGSVIGENGAALSGGEKQRISIARAMIKDAPIVILDEATSNIDPENEQLIQHAMEELTRDKTIIMIAHRLKTVRNADQIIVMNQGRIAQRGTHEQLMKQGGIYASLINVRTEALGWKLSWLSWDKYEALFAYTAAIAAVISVVLQILDHTKKK